MGRPRLDIDFESFEKLCALHCTLEEIAAFLHVSADTVERRVKEHYGSTFAEIHREKAAAGKISLRRAMWEKATKSRDNTMLIWLSKNHLGMSDKHEERVIQEKPTEVKIIWQSVPAEGEEFYDRKQAYEEDEGPMPQDDVLPAVEVPS